MAASPMASPWWRWTPTRNPMARSCIRSSCQHRRRISPFGWNACSSSLSPLTGHAFLERRYLIIPGIRSSRIYVIDAKEPLKAKIHKIVEPEEVFAKTGYSRPPLLHRADELALQHPQHGAQIVAAFQYLTVHADHRILPLPVAQAGAFLDPVKRVFGGAAKD